MKVLDAAIILLKYDLYHIKCVKLSRYMNEKLMWNNMIDHSQMMDPVQGPMFFCRMNTNSNI